jgi:hypothetical protein
LSLRLCYAEMCCFPRLALAIAGGFSPGRHYKSNTC